MYTENLTSSFSAMVSIPRSQLSARCCTCSSSCSSRTSIAATSFSNCAVELFTSSYLSRARWLSTVPLMRCWISCIFASTSAPVASGSSVARVTIARNTSLTHTDIPFTRKERLPPRGAAYLSPYVVSNMVRRSLISSILLVTASRWAWALFNCDDSRLQSCTTTRNGPRAGRHLSLEDPYRVGVLLQFVLQFRHFLLQLRGDVGRDGPLRVQLQAGRARIGRGLYLVQQAIEQGLVVLLLPRPLR